VPVVRFTGPGTEVRATAPSDAHNHPPPPSIGRIPPWPPPPRHRSTGRIPPWPPTTPSLADLKVACGLLTGIVIGTRYPYAHLDGLPPESFDALMVAIRRLELAAQQTRLLSEEPVGGGHRFLA
jgi:hypothetical protein